MTATAGLQAAPKRHLLIAGTGRAGTSFLVRYLTELGQETHYTLYGDDHGWNEEAQAGAEDLPLSKVWPQLPYVIKSTWAVELIDQLLADNSIVLDAVIVPIRDLREAASSRTINEFRNFAEQTAGSTKLDQPWENWGHTPGGVIYSMHPLDQARILAHGLYRLLERLAAADIPVILISFPRFAEDADYLYHKLAPLLNNPPPIASARRAHAGLSDPAKIRVAREIAETDLQRLDRAGLNREIERLRQRIALLEQNRPLPASAAEKLD